MKEYISTIIKDLLISILVIICVLIFTAIIFYNKIALTRVIPQSEEYSLTGDMQEEMEKSGLEEAEEVVVSYYIDATDLKKYEKTKEYQKGKNNPFAVEEENAIISNEIVENSSTENANRFYEDDGTK